MLLAIIAKLYAVEINSQAVYTVNFAAAFFGLLK